MTEQQFRPSWDDYFMAIARIVATRATCDRLHAGAVLVEDHRIVSTGYNGAPPHTEHCDDAGHLLEDGHCVRTIHAEHNALLQAAVIGGSSTKGATLYSLYTPCVHCAKYVVAAGVTRVVVGKYYRNEHAAEYFKKAGILFEVYHSKDGWYPYISELFTHDIADREGAVVQLTESK